MAGYSMDVDPPVSSSSSSQGSGTLKRSSSAPLIHLSLYDGVQPNDSHVLIPPPQLFGSQPRARRFSASFSPNSHSPQSPMMPSRINQIKHEEGMDVVNREVAHEREVQSALQMSLSCEDLTLKETFLPEEGKNNLLEPLHIFASPVLTSSSLSPTPTRKQCYSPSIQQPVRSPNPSPTRRTYIRRSASPIALRPSLFPTKRKCDLDDKDGCMSPHKRFHSGSLTPERGLLATHPLKHSLSSSSLEESSSPEQIVPLGRAMGTPESISSSDSLCNMFKPVDQDAHMQDSSPPTPDSLVLQDSTT